MGWGQPTVGVGKRVRHSSEHDNNSEFANNSSNQQSEDLGSHFNKRPRDVSPRKMSGINMNDNITQRDLPKDHNGQMERIEDSCPSCSCSSSETQCSYDDLQYSNRNSRQLMEDGQSYQNIQNSDKTHSNSKVQTDDIQESDEVTNEKMEMCRSPSTTLSMSATLKGVRISSCRKGPRILTAFRGNRAPRNVFARKASAHKCARRKSSEITVADAETEDYDDCEMKGEAEADECSVGSSDLMLPDVCRRVVPSIRPSYFPYVPPYMNFCLHDERVQAMPEGFKKHLKWRLSPITPIVVKKTVANSGFRLLRKTVEWGGEWGKHMKISAFRSALKDYQKLNHLPATFQIGRKDRLWKNVHRYMTKFGKDEFGFVPRTYVLPQETKQLKAAWEASGTKGTPWIVKPPAAARGTGIRVVNKWNQVPKKKPVIVQMYIANPFLINDRKFDLRLYVLVTSFHPLKVYMYNDGLVRFAPIKYSTKSNTVGDRYMHLTNYSINKNCELYTANEDADSCHGHKWTLSTLWRYLEAQMIDTSILKQKMEEIVIKTLISAEDAITTASLSMPNRYNGYELFGFDIIFDSQLKPWLLEVNISPSLHSSSPLDLAVKGPLVQEVFNIVGFHLPPKIPPEMKKLLLKELDVELEQESPVFDKRIYCTHLTKEEKIKHSLFKTKFSHRYQYAEKILEELSPSDVRQLITAEDELSQCEKFTRIFPTPSSNTYFPFFENPRYYNILLDSWEHKYYDNRIDGITKLIDLCRQKHHLEVPSVFKNPTYESPDIITAATSNNSPAAVTAATLQNPSEPDAQQIASNGEPGVKDKRDLGQRGDDEDSEYGNSNVCNCLQPDDIMTEGHVTENGDENRRNERDGLSSASSSSSTTSTSPSEISDSNSSLSSSSYNNCHDEDRLSVNGNGTTPQVPEYIKGVCY